MEKFGYASATTTVTSAPGSTSRARSAALMPASLPPIAAMCMIDYLSSLGTGWSCPGREPLPVSCGTTTCAAWAGVSAG